MSMQESEPITVKRDCDAILIPAGTHICLPQGSIVFITQALGGNYTVNINGNLAQISAKDANALGIEVTDTVSLDETDANEDGSLHEEHIWAQLRTCYDPEIPHNIVDLGLIYDCKISKHQNGDNQVDILMTLTAPGCGMGEFLAEDVRCKVAAIPNVTTVNVELTFDPHWGQELMSEATRLELGIY